jgi:hypothetical protein
MNLKNRETPPELPAEEFKTERRQERIEDGIWIPGIFDEYKNEVAVAASTKLIKK